MTERTNTIGCINVARSVFEHDLFADEPFTEREAWVWLIAKAERKPVDRIVVMRDM